MLELGGLLLVQDQSFPNVVTIMTGESLLRSWWSHPQSMEVLRHLCAVTSHPDVLDDEVDRRQGHDGSQEAVEAFAGRRDGQRALAVGAADFFGACAPGNASIARKM